MRPIDANALMDFARNHVNRTVDCNDIARFPTLDYVPVKRGEWIRANEEQVYFDVEYMCSECQFVVAVSGIGRPLLYGYKHCPKCGAKMDGGK